jgi:hypothetical protein
MLARTQLVSFLVLTTLGTGWLLSQDSKPAGKPESKPTRTLPSGWSLLGLTKAQKEKIHEVRDGYRVKVDPLQKQLAELQRQLADLRSKEREELLEVLTEAQKSRLKELTPVKPASSKPSRENPKDDGERKPAKEKESS